MVGSGLGDGGLDDAGGPGGGFGYELPADSPVSLDSRTLCLGPPDVHPQVVSLYDGHEAFDVWMDRGTGNLSGVELSIIGTPI